MGRESAAFERIGLHGNIHLVCAESKRKPNGQLKQQCLPEYADALFEQGIQAMLDGDVGVGKSIVRDYINATIGFEALAKEVDKSPKSVMRMFSDKGNPNASNLFTVISKLQHSAKKQLQVSSVAA